MASQSPSTTPSAPPTKATEPAAPDGHGWKHGNLPSLSPAAALRDLPFGQQHRFSEGSRARLIGTPDAARLEVTYRGQTSTASVPPGSNPAALVSTQLQLGQAGSGYLVRAVGGDHDEWTVFVPQNGQLVTATVTGDAPFGGGFLDNGTTTYQSWLGRGGNSIFTLVSTAGAPRHHFTVYQWEVPGPGEGGGPDNTAVELVPTSLGDVCLDNRTGEYGRC